MKPQTSSEIRGNWATLLLPINADDSIDHHLLADEIDHYIAARVNGIYSNGSAGEFYTQTETEFDDINQLLAEKCEKARMPFQIGASHMSPQLSLERLRRAKALCPSAFQIILPDWFVPAWPEILAFLERMQEEAAPIPLVIYNPPHAKRHLTPDEWLQIARRFPGVAGMKVPGGDDAWYRAMQPVFEKLSVFIPGHTLASGISHGAHGAYSNVACLNPAAAQRWYELCIRDIPAGLALEAKLRAFWDANVVPLITEKKLPNMAADKATAVAGSWLPGLTPRLRWPYACATTGDVARISRAYRELNCFSQAPA
ncbi:dihydrodipicolinate synthase family protein [Geminisphaera colitermitum]|uniref:dihydrodipicolinate synthase family protein n=1 Tax=Geminisphaera colitermitum TaxID=1148786 RepID=UPI000158D5A9|nr:dihydrodipicolinate synthase family protein [Geminisphaera colitermitum]